MCSILSSINIAKKGQKRAIARISKNKKGVQRMHGLTRFAKTIISCLTNPADARFDKGYVLLTPAQWKYANGQITDAEVEKMGAEFYSGKKIICGVDVNALDNRLSIIPIR